jgi:hypothetical protein
MRPDGGGRVDAQDDVERGVAVVVGDAPVGEQLGPPTLSQVSLTVWFGAKPDALAVTIVPFVAGAWVRVRASAGWYICATVNRAVAEVRFGPTAWISCGPNAAPAPSDGTFVVMLT